MVTDDRGSRREPALNLPVVISGLIALLLTIHAVRELLLTRDQDGWVVYYFSVIPLRFTIPVLDPAWSFVASPVSYSLLHGSWPHLIINSVWLMAFGAPLARTLGATRFLAFWALTAAAGAAAHVAAYPQADIPMIGASGAVSGITAAASRFAFRTFGRDGQRAFGPYPLPLLAMARQRQAMVFIAVWFAINASLSFGWFDTGGASIAWQAHVGGFIAGLLVLPLVMPRR